MKPLEIKAFRKTKKMTQAALADWLGVKTRTVVAWENEQNPVPDWAVKKMTSETPSLNPKLSLDEFRKLNKIAEEQDKTVEELIADIIKKFVGLLIFFAVCASLFRWAETGDPATGAMLGVADTATLAAKALFFAASCGLEILKALIG